MTDQSCLYIFLTQGAPQDIVSSVVLENEEKNLVNLKEIKNRLSQHAHSFLRCSKLEELFDADCRDLLLGEGSWIIRYAIVAPV